MIVKQPQFNTCWIDPRVEIRNSRIHGRGMFSKETINESEKIVIWGGLLMSKKEIELAKHRPESDAQVADDLYIAEPAGMPEGLDDFLNHSCNPNLWMEDEYTLITKRGIKKGEELMIDYALFLSEFDWKMKCLCGAENCRGLVTGNDWKLKELQDQYKNYFSPYLNEKIKELND